MNIDLIAVFGPHDAIRNRYSKQLAQTTDRTLVPASEFTFDHDPGSAAIDYLRWFNSGITAVVEMPATAQPSELIAACTSTQQPDTTSCKLNAIVCVLDARQLLQDLTTEEFLVAAVDSCGNPSDFIARAAITVSQIELAATVVVTNWQQLETAQLSAIMALLSTLAPTAAVRLADPQNPLMPDLTEITAAQDRAGWMQIINGIANPPFLDPAVSALRFERLRPFHPQRLAKLLQQDFEGGQLGKVIRSAGFCRLATRPGELLLWDQVGRTIAFHSVTTAANDDPEYAALAQDIAFIGFDLNHEAITRSLDEALLTDAEFAAGFTLWRQLADPFPASETAADAAG